MMCYRGLACWQNRIALVAWSMFQLDVDGTALPIGTLLEFPATADWLDAVIAGTKFI
jgi:hypothetical protein